MKTSVQVLVVLAMAAIMTCGCGRKSAAQKRAEAAAKEMEKLAEKMGSEGQGSADDMAKAMAAMQKAMEAQPQATLVDFRELKALLPESLPGLKRSNATGERTGAMGFSVARAEATYDNDEGASIDVEITDIGGLHQAAAMTQFAWAAHEVDRETETGYEKTTTIADHKAHEEYDRENQTGKLQLLVKGRFLVEVRGNNVDMSALHGVVKAIDLAKLEKLAR